MKKIYIVFTVLFAFNSYAGIRVYDAQSGKEQDKEVLIKQDTTMPALGDLTEEQFKKMSKQDFFKYIKQEPNENKNIEKQKITNLGTVIFFTDIKSLNPSISDLMNELGEVKDIRSEFYLKEPRTASAFSLAGLKMGKDFKHKLKVDSNGKNVRRLHVNSFPAIIFVDKNKNISRYSGTSGGVMALKLRLGEARALEQTYNYQ